MIIMKIIIKVITSNIPLNRRTTEILSTKKKNRSTENNNTKKKERYYILERSLSHFYLQIFSTQLTIFFTYAI